MVLFLARFLLFSNLFFWLGHSLWNSKVSRTQVFADGRLDYGEFLAIFLLVSISVLLGWLAALSFVLQRKQPEVRWEKDNRSDDIMDIISPHVIEKIDPRDSSQEREHSRRGDKRARFREEIKRDVSQGGKI